MINRNLFNEYTFYQYVIPQKVLTVCQDYNYIFLN